MKTPGQKVYEKAQKRQWLADVYQSVAWDDLAHDYRRDWEDIAAAPTAPEPKTYGKFLEDAYGSACCRDNTSADEDWSSAALALIAEAKRRGDL